MAAGVGGGGGAEETGRGESQKTEGQHPGLGLVCTRHGGWREGRKGGHV